MFIRTRKQLEKLEKNYLAPYATTTASSSGRRYKEPLSFNRLAFQVDRDRIIHSRSFRRLKDKTQVFLAHHGDHFRTRLTHTLEVAQLSRDLARSLGLNEDLAESIALAHDLGHTPFGHAGEEVVNEIMQQFGQNFEHNQQSKRIVTILERGYPDFPGLNLSLEVIDGLMKHQTTYDQPRKKLVATTLEAQVVDLADEITYQAHDTDDGLRANLLNLKSLKKLALINETLDLIKKKYGDLPAPIFLDRLISSLFKVFIKDVLNQTAFYLKKYQIKNRSDLIKVPGKIITLSVAMSAKNQELKKYLWDNLYFHPQVSTQAKKGQKIIQTLFDAYFSKVSLLPEDLKTRLKKGEKKEIIIKDYIAGMTDNFAQQEYAKIS